MTLVLVIIVIALTTGVIYLLFANRELRAMFVRESLQHHELLVDYKKLIDDLKTLAMRPQIAVANPEGPKRARSTAELRKMFDQENAKVLADREQSR